jgi:hypothetical protein
LDLFLSKTGLFDLSAFADGENQAKANSLSSRKIGSTKPKTMSDFEMPDLASRSKRSKSVLFAGTCGCPNPSSTEKTRPFEGHAKTSFLTPANAQNQF